MSEEERYFVALRLGEDWVLCGCVLGSEEEATLHAISKVAHGAAPAAVALKVISLAAVPSPITTGPGPERQPSPGAHGVDPMRLPDPENPNYDVRRG